ncbi:uracil-DNA glycosylase family protein [Microvirga roseola]|uniref:uracil-DNA glycosylase family protein n=1 Tax=Microvirga roseola TaxID=2883126 RepID=UPI001E633573|nr:uracil-DNA glycosylase family protein [Microvirga roseola]
MDPTPDFQDIVRQLKACRICRDAPLYGEALPHEPHPVIQGSATARLCIVSQAPGTKSHAIGIPFPDRSGSRLRNWLGLDETTFYDASRIALVPMGACFPGQNARGGDLAPRRECSEIWHERIFAALPSLELVLLIGQYAQARYLGEECRDGLTETVRQWRRILSDPRKPRILPLPHPSWRNNGWIRTNPWFEEELLPVLRAELRSMFKLETEELEA